ncbi:hypothetical protein [Exiguobacterium sp. R-17]|uniref:hypothetical protein n=1 Tax=Exiguobacterium sp. R-17 TaxID=3404054 RepID=UPI003CF931DF
MRVHDLPLACSELPLDLGNQELAYDLFRRISEIDFGPNMKTSDAGNPCGFAGGIW